MESGKLTDSDIYWGKNFLTLNVDSADQPVNIDIRPGKYNAVQLAAVSYTHLTLPTIVSV